MKHRKIITLVTTLIGIALIAYLCVGRRNRDLISILKENPEIQLTSIKITGGFEGKPRAVFLNDPEIVKYVTTILRKTNQEPKLGCVYDAQLEFNNGEKCLITFYIPQGGQSLSIGLEKGWLEDLEHYGVDLVNPVPKGLTDALIQLSSVDYMQSPV